ERTSATKLVQSNTVHCSDRERPKFKIVLEGQFLPAVVIPAPRIDLGTVIAASRLRVEIEAFNWTCDPVRLMAADAANGLSDASRDLLAAPRSEAGPGMASLGLELEAPRVAGPHRWRITWLTGLESQPTIDVELVAVVKAGAEISPRMWISLPGGVMVPIALVPRLDPPSADTLPEQRTEAARAASLTAGGACGPQSAAEATSTQNNRGVQ
ncbi:MAG: hypothetical protein ACREA0_14650, partial [bacterium]